MSGDLRQYANWLTEQIKKGEQLYRRNALGVGGCGELGAYKTALTELYRLFPELAQDTDFNKAEMPRQQ